MGGSYRKRNRKNKIYREESTKRVFELTLRHTTAAVIAQSPSSNALHMRNQVFRSSSLGLGSPIWV